MQFQLLEGYSRTVTSGSEYEATRCTAELMQRDGCFGHVAILVLNKVRILALTKPM